MLKLVKRRVGHISALLHHALIGVSTGVRRSPKWRHVETSWIREHGCCEACGGKVHLNVHHKLPFHLDEAMELDTTNLITLCMEIGKHCHIKVGHGNDFKAYNPNVVPDSLHIIAARKINDVLEVLTIEDEARKNRLYELVPVDKAAAA